MSMVDNSDRKKVKGKLLGLPHGTDYSILEKIEWADSLFEEFGSDLLKDPRIQDVLSRYRAAIAETSKVMEETGVIAECTDCAINDGGSCCGKGIEAKFTVALLLLNRLLGSRLDKERQDMDGCWFLGERGCKIAARHTICVNYLCKRLQRNIARNKLQRLQRYIGAEADAAFVAEEELKQWFHTRKMQGG